MHARRQLWWSLIAPHLPLAVVLAIAMPLLWPATYLGDHFTFWAAGHIVAAGGSPYDPAAWSDGAIEAAVASGMVIDMRSVIARCCAVLWAYPPWTGLALAPFGALPYDIGVPLLHLTSFAAAAAAAIGLARALPWRHSATYALALALFALSEPFIVGVRGGHFVGVLLFGVYLVERGLRLDRAWPLVAGAVLLSLKPHPVLVLAVVVFGILVARRRWRQLAWTSAVLAAIAAVATMRYPGSLVAMAAGSAERAGVGGTTLWTFVADTAGGSSIAVAALAAAGLCAACVVSLRLVPRRFRVEALVAWALTVDLALVPYLQDHDDLLLIPALFLCLAFAEFGRHSRVWYVPAVVTAFVVAPWLVQLVALAGGVALAGALPLVAAMALLIASAAASAGRPASTSV